MKIKETIRNLHTYKNFLFINNPTLWCLYPYLKNKTVMLTEDQYKQCTNYGFYDVDISKYDVPMLRSPHDFRFMQKFLTKN